MKEILGSFFFLGGGPNDTSSRGRCLEAIRDKEYQRSTFDNKTKKKIKINLPPPKVNIEPEHDGHDGSEDDIPLPVVH